MDGAWGSWHDGTWGEWTAASDQYSYDWGLTPSITSIYPSAMSAASTSVLTASWSRLKLNKGPRQIRRQPACGLARGSWLSLKLCYGISLDLRRTVGSEGSTS